MVFLCVIQMKQTINASFSFYCVFLYYQLIINRQYQQQFALIQQDMFYRTKVDKSCKGGKDKNNENNNKKKKKNRNISPNKTIDPQKYKQDSTNTHRKTELTERSLQKSNQKILNKLVINHKQETKSRKVSKKLNNSPIKQQKKNLSPFPKQHSHSRSKEKSPSTSRKNTAKVKANDQKPLQTIKRQLFDNKQKKSKSPIQKVKSKQKKNNTTKYPSHKDDKQIKREKYQNTPIKLSSENRISKDQEKEQEKGGIKRRIKQISTQFSAQQQSLFHSSLFERLQNHKFTKGNFYFQNCFLQSIHKQDTINNPISFNPITIDKKQTMQVLQFKRQQQQKWNWMLQQIKNLKNQQDQIGDKIDWLINSITQNYRTLQRKVNQQVQTVQEQVQTVLEQVQSIQSAKEKFVRLQQNQTYSNLTVDNCNKVKEMQVAIQPNVLQEQSRSHMISLEDFFNSDKRVDKNLKRELFSPKKSEYQFYLKNQLQTTHKQLMEQCNELVINQQTKIENHTYLQQLIIKQQTPLLSPDQPKQHSFQNQKIQLTHMIQTALIDDFCQNLLRNKKILHCFLIHFDSPYQNNIPQLPDYLLPSSNDYTLQIVHKLLDYLFSYHRQYFFTQTSYYYQCKAEQILRYVRSNFQQEEAQMNYQIQNESLIQIPFFNLQKIYQFQTDVLKTQHYSPQAFNLNYFNQCIYDSFNDIIDNLRPYGSKGKPIFTKQLSHPMKTQSLIRHKILNKFNQIFENEWEQQFINDNLIHGEQGNFQIVYFLSLQITQLIYNQCVMEISRI